MNKKETWLDKLTDKKVKEIFKTQYNYWVDRQFDMPEHLIHKTLINELYQQFSTNIKRMKLPNGENAIIVECCRKENRHGILTTDTYKTYILGEYNVYCENGSHSTPYIYDYENDLKTRRGIQYCGITQGDVANDYKVQEWIKFLVKLNKNRIINNQTYKEAFITFKEQENSNKLKSFIKKFK